LVIRQAQQTLAQDAIPNNCETAITPEERAIFARLEQAGNRLTLVNWETGETVQLLAEELQGHSILGWSLDCRYLAIKEGTQTENHVVVYDVIEGHVLGNVDGDEAKNPYLVNWQPDNYLFIQTPNGGMLWHVPSGNHYEGVTRVDWSANNQYALLRTKQGYFIFEPDTGKQTLLVYSLYGDDTHFIKTHYELVWDLERDQLIIDAWGGTLIFDIATGQEIAFLDYRLHSYNNDYNNGCSFWGCRFEMNDNNTIDVIGHVGTLTFDYDTFELLSISPYGVIRRR
jgi:hypothetical protein